MLDIVNVVLLSNRILCALLASIIELCSDEQLIYLKVTLIFLKFGVLA